jgi:hypothetical protein
LREKRTYGGTDPQQGTHVHEQSDIAAEEQGDRGNVNFTFSATSGSSNTDKPGRGAFNSGSKLRKSNNARRSVISAVLLPKDMVRIMLGRELDKVRQRVYAIFVVVATSKVKIRSDEGASSENRRHAGLLGRNLWGRCSDPSWVL